MALCKCSSGEPGRKKTRFIKVDVFKAADAVKKLFRKRRERK